jgi:hypothetical protein
MTFELFMHIFIPESALRNRQLSIGARLFLLCYSLTISFLFIVVISCFLALLKRIRNRTGMLLFTRGLMASLTWLVLLVYCSSWALFWQTGRFIDSQTFLFLAPHPLQVFHWVDTDLAVTVLALALVGTWAFLFWLPGWVQGQTEIARRRLLLVSGWIISIALFGGVLSQAYSNTDGRKFMRTTIVFTKNRADALGPVPHIVADIRKKMQLQSRGRFSADDIRIIQRPIITMDRYSALASQRSHNHWNVIVLVIESLRSDQLRIYGSNRDVLPFLDALA